MPLSRLLRSCLVLAALAIGCANYAAAQDAAVKPYPFKKCLVNGDDIDSDATVIVYKGQEFKLCCKKCIKKFNADPEKWLAELQKQEKAGTK